MRRDLVRGRGAPRPKKSRCHIPKGDVVSRGSRAGVEEAEDPLCSRLVLLAVLKTALLQASTKRAAWYVQHLGLARWSSSLHPWACS